MEKIDRILKYIESQGISVFDFERKAGLSSSYLANTKKRGSDLTYKAMTKIRTNLKDEYYKIFPEEKEGGKVEGDNPSVAGTSFAPPEIAKLQSEIEMLKIMLEGKEELIQSLQRVIELQDRILKGGRDTNGNDGETKRSA